MQIERLDSPAPSPRVQVEQREGRVVVRILPEKWPGLLIILPLLALGWVGMVGFGYSLRENAVGVATVVGATVWGLGVVGYCVATWRIVWLFNATEVLALCRGRLELGTSFLGRMRSRQLRGDILKNVRCEEQRRRRGLVEHYVVFESNDETVASVRPLRKEDAEFVCALFRDEAGRFLEAK